MYNECRHLFISGKKCKSPALTNENFCYYHTTTRKREKHTADNQPYDRVLSKQTALALPTLDEGDSIQLAISEVVLALAANIIDPRRARILLYGLQIASQHYRHRQGAPCKPSVGLNGDVQNIVRETFLEADGLELGPEKQSPDPEDLPEEEWPMGLGKYLLLEAIKDGLVDPERVRQREQEWKEQRARERNQEKQPTRNRLNLQAVAEEPTNPLRQTMPQNTPQPTSSDDFTKTWGYPMQAECRVPILSRSVAR